ncbi:unnamed protein product [Malus baccata var. baccata]
MAHIFSYASILQGRTAQHQHHLSFPPNPPHNVYRFRCRAENRTTNSPTDKESQPQNALLKVAWYSSELLGIATSFFRPPSASEPPPGPALELGRDGSGAVDRAVVVKSIKEDFERSYFVTGNLRLDAYEEDCEFADPATSFRGLQRFKRNCTNFGSLLVKSNMKLMKWEDFEDKGIGHWRFSCVLTFPWRPILSGMLLASSLLSSKIFITCPHNKTFRLTSFSFFFTWRHQSTHVMNLSLARIITRETVTPTAISI